MKVVGLVSSPRKGGNSEIAVKEIFRQLPADWEKEMIRVNELNINYCTACYACVPEGARCRQKDDFNFLVDKIKEADKVVIAAPTYILGCHTAIKMVMDRLISLVADYNSFKKADCVIVSSYGYGGWEGMVKEDMQLFAKKLHLNVIGHEVMLATLPGDTVKGENLEKITGLANLLINGADGPIKPTTKGIECPICASTGFQVNPDGSVRCMLCSVEGKFMHGPGGLRFEYDPEFNHKFTNKSLDDHVQYLIDKKDLFLATRGEIKALQAEYAELDWWVTPAPKE
ncbi:MAG: flavodoxin family protein [Firmicutes bacterium]|nr:flavodoxin family protein [Bacillota bacterium]